MSLKNNLFNLFDYYQMNVNLRFLKLLNNKMVKVKYLNIFN